MGIHFSFFFFFLGVGVGCACGFLAGGAIRDGLFSVEIFSRCDSMSFRLLCLLCIYFEGGIRINDIGKRMLCRFSLSFEKN